jgi:hypothetical protein
MKGTNYRHKTTGNPGNYSKTKKKNANSTWLHTVLFHLHHSLEMTAFQGQSIDQWLPGVGAGVGVVRERGRCGRQQGPLHDGAVHSASSLRCECWTLTMLLCRAKDKHARTCTHTHAHTCTRMHMQYKSNWMYPNTVVGCTTVDILVLCPAELRRGTVLHNVTNGENEATFRGCYSS